MRNPCQWHGPPRAVSSVLLGECGGAQCQRSLAPGPLVPSFSPHLSWLRASVPHKHTRVIPTLYKLLFYINDIFYQLFCGRKGLEEREVGRGIPGRQSAKTGWAEVGYGKHGTHPEIRLSPTKMAPTPYIFIW